MSSLKLIKEQKAEASLSNEIILYEQLALKRIKEFHWERWKPSKLPGPAILLSLLRAMLSLPSQNELIRQIGPGIEPQREYDWKSLPRHDGMR